MNVTQSVAQPAHVPQSARAISPPDHAATFGLDQPDPGAIDAIKARYDMTNITPHQIDQLAADLQAAGHAFGGEMLTLLTYGAEFRSHAAELFGGQTQPDRPMNLIEHSQTQHDTARRMGDPTDHWDMLLKFLDGFEGANAKPAAQNTAQQIVEARMQAN